MVGPVVNPTSLQAAGVAYIGLPYDVDRDVYLRDCYMNARVTIRLEDGAVINHAPIDVDVLNFIEFPKVPEELGTAVVYLTEPIHQHPMIIARVQKGDQLGDGREHFFKIRRIINDQIVSIDGDAHQGFININVIAGDKQGKVKIKLDNKTNDNIFEVQVAGEIKLTTSNRTHLSNHNEFISEIIDEEKEQDKPSIIRQKRDVTTIGNKEVVINADKVKAIHYKGYRIEINAEGIFIDALDKKITLQAGDSSIEFNRRGIEIKASKINLNGQFEALYNKIPGAPITHVSQIGISKTVKLK